MDNAKSLADAVDELKTVGYIDELSYSELSLRVSNHKFFDEIQQFFSQKDQLILHGKNFNNFGNLYCIINLKILTIEEAEKKAGENRKIHGYI